MQLLLNVSNEKILDKLLRTLENFKNDGVEICNEKAIIETRTNTNNSSKTLSKIDELFSKSNNKKIATKELVINTDGITDDIS